MKTLTETFGAISGAQQSLARLERFTEAFAGEGRITAAFGAPGLTSMFPAARLALEAGQRSDPGARYLRAEEQLRRLVRPFFEVSDPRLLAPLLRMKRRKNT